VTSAAEPVPAQGPVGRITIVSGVLAAIGVAFLTAMYASFAVGATPLALAFGRINDVLVMLAYLLAIPVAIAVCRLLRPRAPLMSMVAAVTGIGALGVIVVLQFLLVVGALTFEEEVGPVSIALLILGVWFVLIGYLGRTSGVLPNGVRWGILGATYVGYPIWAFWMSRRLAEQTPAFPVQRRPLMLTKE
jgi:hypothetical protein